MSSSPPRPRPEPPRTAAVCLVAIAGGSGSGKTWLARQLLRRLRPHAAVLSLDDFYRDLAHLAKPQRDRVNFDSPEAIEWPLLQRCLSAIRQGEAVRVPRYDFATHTRKPHPRSWAPRPIVLVEGLWPWGKRELRPLYALKIFRTSSSALRLARRLRRDVRDRARSPASVRRQWRHQVEPACARFVHPQARTADLIVPTDLSAEDVDRLADRIRALASRPQSPQPGTRPSRDHEGAGPGFPEEKRGREPLVCTCVARLMKAQERPFI